MTTIPVSIFEFDNTYARAVEELSTEWSATNAPEPEIIVFNETLAEELGVDPDVLQSEAGVALLAGNAELADPRPTAQVYAGHQFGGYSAQLGDGRALLLGEVIDADGERRDIQLKGSGRTPFSRGGDGKAALGPMLREFLVAEAMAVLGVPTTRALAVVATGEKIARTGMEEGAVLTRVAASHLRVGTFEYAARLRDKSVLKQLADYAIERHHPHAADAAEPYVALLDAVVEAQAQLIAKWMLVGFVHGVMNTDNMTISGEGIDYGPCAFIDQFDPAAVFSSIDHAGRYAFGNQPSIAVWNLSRLAESLLPLIDTGDSDAAVALVRVPLESFMPRFQQYYDDGMRAKLGLTTPPPATASCSRRGLACCTASQVDYTNSFRGLARWIQGDQEALQSPSVTMTCWLLD
ncbi:MAG: YdiU family protein [Acidimicrobiales bacterium]